MSCAFGGAHIRLRPGAANLARSIPDARTEPTADGRVSVHVRQAPVTTCPLHALLVPERSAGIESLRVTRLHGTEAVFALMRLGRIAGWRDPGILRGRLEGLGRVTRTLPVYRAEIPWGSGPAFPSDVIRRIAAAVGLAGERVPA